MAIHGKTRRFPQCKGELGKNMFKVYIIKYKGHYEEIGYKFMNVKTTVKRSVQRVSQQF